MNQICLLVRWCSNFWGSFPRGSKVSATKSQFSRGKAFKSLPSTCHMLWQGGVNQFGDSSPNPPVFHRSAVLLDREDPSLTSLCQSLEVLRPTWLKVGSPCSYAGFALYVILASRLLRILGWHTQPLGGGSQLSFRIRLTWRAFEWCLLIERPPPVHLN